MKQYSFILIIALISCKSNNSVESSSQPSNGDKSIHQVDTLILNIGDEEAKKKDIMQLSNWTKVISNHKLGFLAIGDSINPTLDILEDYFNVDFDSIPYCSGCLDDNEYYYKFLDNSLDLKFTIHPGQTGKAIELIQAFVLYDSLYVTNKGISVGSTVKDIKSKYSVSRIVYEQECGLFLFVKGFDGSFGLEYEPDEDGEELTLTDIPEEVRINQIAIY